MSPQEIAEKIKSDKEYSKEWLEWLNYTLDRSNDENYTITKNNRVFLTNQDDIDIADHVLGVFKELIKLQ
jgi:hypothetical protein